MNTKTQPAAVAVAALLDRHYDSGDPFTNRELKAFNKELPVPMNEKTLDNRLGDKLVELGVAVRVKPGHYFKRSFPALLKQAVVEGSSYKPLAGSRSRVPKTYAARKAKLRAQYLPMLMASQSNVCALCGLDMVHIWFAELDHAQALAAGGEDEVFNCLALHAGCNGHKSKMTLAEAREKAVEAGVPVNHLAADVAFQEGMASGAQVPSDYFK